MMSHIMAFIVLLMRLCYGRFCSVITMNGLLHSPDRLIVLIQPVALSPSCLAFHTCSRCAVSSMTLPLVRYCYDPDTDTDATADADATDSPTVQLQRAATPQTALLWESPSPILTPTLTLVAMSYVCTRQMTDDMRYDQ